MSIRVLIVDDQAMVRAGFSMILGAAGDIDVVGEAGDGREAVAAARRLRPDVVVMDVQMPVLDGVAATRQIVAASDAAPRILVVTTFDVDDYVYDALRAGASGFMLKNAPPEELVAAVRVLARGDALLAPAVTRRVIARFARQAAPATTAARLDELTQREREVFALVARGLSNAEIADRLVVSHGTVKTHVARILMKLGLRDRVQAVVLAYESGAVAPGQGD
ncbi:MAG TPA: response regulator transcription factor [Solirubrobacteraceae bacterium]|jgi:DNA-binding NarL/FixJ family response regulator|nr:response regulator transcription factor [Solirubrobacteraceae bacterium]